MHFDVHCKKKKRSISSCIYVEKLLAYFNFNFIKARRERQGQNAASAFPCFSYDRFYKVKAKISPKLIFSRHTWIDTSFYIKNVETHWFMAQKIYHSVAKKWKWLSWMTFCYKVFFISSRTMEVFKMIELLCDSSPCILHSERLSRYCDFNGLTKLFTANEKKVNEIR